MWRMGLMAELNMSHEDADGEIQGLLASIERSLEWLRRTESDEVVSLTSEIQQILDGIRGMVRGT